MLQSNVTKWSEFLPPILLVIRSIIKKDFQCKPVQLIYKTNLTFPDQLIMYEDKSLCERLVSHMNNISPVAPQPVFTKWQVNKHLDKCEFVFVRVDSIRRLLQQLHKVPCRAFQRGANDFTNKKKEEKEAVSTDRNKYTLV